jgi:hypothetical protein
MGSSSEPLSRGLYALVEPYDSGFLKVSDVHTIYYEQSGNPQGHVSLQFLSLCVRFDISESSYDPVHAMWASNPSLSLRVRFDIPESFDNPAHSGRIS